MAQLFVNNGKTTLAAPLANGATSATLTSGTIFPAIAAPDFMLLTLDDGTNIEVVKVTAHTASSTTITISRAADGSTQYAGTWAATSTKVECRWTKGSIPSGTIVRETFSNANYTITDAADRMVAQIGTLSASRTVTLPSAAGRAGQRFIILDESGSVTWANNIVITRAGTDQFYGTNGAAASSIRIWVPYGGVELISDGTSKWMIVRRFPCLWYVRWTANTTFNREPDMKWATVGCQGGGGGGGASSMGTNFYGGAGAGGSGGWLSRDVDISGSATYSVTIGGAGTAAATAGSTGGTGGTSSFGSLVSAVGGGGGGGTSSNSGGVGGTGAQITLGAPYVGTLTDATYNGGTFAARMLAANGGEGRTTTNTMGAAGEAFTSSGFTAGTAGATVSGSKTGGAGGAGSMWGNGGNGATFNGTSWTNATAGTLGSGGGGGGTEVGLTYGTPAAGGAGFVEIMVYF